MINIVLQDALLIYILLYLLGLILMLFISFKYKKRIGGITFFNCYFLLTILGMLGIYFRLDLNSWISIILANLVLMIASLFLLLSILRFLNKKIPYLILSVFSLIYLLLFIYFTEIDFNVFARIATFGLAIIIIQGYVLHILFQYNKINNRKIDFFSFILSLNIILHTFRIIGLLNSVRPNSFFENNIDSMNVILLGATGAFSVAGILSLINNKLMKDIQEGESALNHFIENMPTPVMVHNVYGEILKISKSFTDLSGYTPEDLPNIETWTELAYRGSNIKEVRDFVKSLYENKDKKGDTEVVVNTKTKGKRKWLFNSGYFGKNISGDDMAISIALDVTESDKLKENLTISESRLQLAQSVAMVGSWELDISTNFIWASKVTFDIISPPPW